jgi:hypothetical protein
MNLKTTAIAAGLAAALGTGAAFAQSYSNPPPSQQQIQGRHHGLHRGIRALIREEVNAGRISQQEGALLEQKIKEIKAERRAQKQSRYEGVQGNYPPPSQQPQ